MTPAYVVIGDEIVAELVARSKPTPMPREAMLTLAQERLEASGHHNPQQGAGYLVWRACSAMRTKVAK